MKVIPISCRCKLSALVPSVRRHLLAPAPRPLSAEQPATTGAECVVRSLTLPPAA